MLSCYQNLGSLKLCLVFSLSVFVLLGCHEGKKSEEPEKTQSTQNEMKTVIVIESGTEMLNAPDGKRTAVLKVGEKLVILSQSKEMVRREGRSNYWYKVRDTNGNEGWVWGDDFRLPEGQEKPVENKETVHVATQMPLSQLIETGNQLLQSDNPSESIPYLLRAVEVSPDDSLAWFLLGLAYQNMGSDEQAIVPYQKAVALSQKDFWAHNNLGLAYIRTGQYDKAVLILEKAITLAPPTDMYYEEKEAREVAARNLLTAYRAVGKTEEASKLAKQYGLN